MAKVQTGDVVKLKSGGGVMTVGEESGVGKFLCYWWDPSSFQVKSEVLPGEALAPTDD